MSVGIVVEVAHLASATLRSSRRGQVLYAGAAVTTGAASGAVVGALATGAILARSSRG